MRLRRRQCIPSCASLRRVDEDEVYWRQKKDDDELEWSHNSTHVISQLAQCFSNAMVGSRSWVIGFFNRYGNKRSGNDKYLDYPLSPLQPNGTYHRLLTSLQEQRLQRLQDRLQVPFDETRTDHQESLRALWHAAFPNIVLRGLISEQWKDMGWQGPNPSTDFRGCGFVSLENLLFFARTYPASFHRLLFKQDGDRATWEYPFAVAGINVSFMLIQMLDLCSAKPKCLPGINFVKLLGEDEEAFDVLYCIAFEMMDAQWLAMHASYMEFNEVLQVTRTQLERELSLEDVHRIQDLPAYNLLYQ
ncbi:ELMO domain-containing protein B isoform X3 [Vitis riparia]|uniref:ELMO domain-containing protein B isoform X3 n=1 Tax=Vitis riparia TaxID=96939 RepID=UPI00155AE733|nr:ELMO domain-containing protein B isoform X3 [Vitis riparia]